jgi:hypothetical protein
MVTIFNCSTNFFFLLQILLFVIIISITNVINREAEKILKYVEIERMCNVIRQSLCNVTLRCIRETAAVEKEGSIF